MKDLENSSEDYLEPSMSDILSARKFLEGRINRTETEYSASLSRKTGIDVWFKWESQQVSGSFKIRGALNRMFQLPSEAKKRGVVTCSSGNHAQGVALAAAEIGVKAVIFVPESCPKTKIEAIQSLGGNWVDLKWHGAIFDETEAEAKSFCSREGMFYVSSYRDRLVMAGAGTVALEMIQDVPDLDTVLVPAGGGGLLNGTAISTKTLNPKTAVWGVQPAASMPWAASWKSGKVVNVNYEKTMADGLSGYILPEMLDLAKKRVSGILTVTETEIAEGMRYVFSNHHMVIEPSAAVVVGAVLAGEVPKGARRLGLIISGRNVDTDLFKGVL